MNNIKFGTDGWRAVISKDFTFENVTKVARAIAEYLISPKRRELSLYKLKSKNTSYKVEFRSHKAGVIVGYDGRFLSDKFAQTIAETLSAYNIPVYLTESITPTPAISWAVKEKKACGAVIVTASHNPPEYNGIKFKPEYAGSALSEITQTIQKHLSKISTKGGSASGGKSKKLKPNLKLIKTFSAKESYLKQLQRLVDLNKINSAKLRIVADSMFGAATGYLEELIGEKNCLFSIRNNINPSFKGMIGPEPLDINLGPLATAIREVKAHLGFAFDGDGDRLGAMDSRGNFINSHYIFILLLWHLVKNKKMTGGVVKTFSTTDKVKLLAKKYNLPFYETPIGFKYLCELMLKEDILIAGEESGGLGFKNHIPERDGILCCLLLLEAVAMTKKNISTLLKNLMQQVGPFYYVRTDLKLKNLTISHKVIKTLEKNTLKNIDGQSISRLENLDGLKYILSDSSWILFRVSGTEPVLRIYAEADSSGKAKKLVKSGTDIVKKMEIRES